MRKKRTVGPNGLNNDLQERHKSVLRVKEGGDKGWYMVKNKILIDIKLQSML